MSVFKAKLTVCTAAANPILATQSLFDASYKEAKGSAIDEFLTRLQAINRLAPTPSNFDPFQGQLVMLGVVAAVESFVRTLFRRTILIDPICKDCVNEHPVSYGAATLLDRELLPEALLEGMTFISKKNIEDALKSLMSIKGPTPPALERAITDYVRVCQLRHCAVHRFGKLGVRNAIALGLADHSKLLEKPLRFDYAALQNMIAISTGFVKTLNNLVFNELLSRIPDTEWTGDYRTDKTLFRQYYYLFADSVSVTRTIRPKALYLEFLEQRKNWAAGRPF
ncbi:hypothetical protein [Dongia sp.]|uniref:hypothetical protein n=1 Tax=Dongia sp. TaxID=1977262 RepID=UPI0035AF1028